MGLRTHARAATHCTAGSGRAIAALPVRLTYAASVSGTGLHYADDREERGGSGSGGGGHLGLVCVWWPTVGEGGAHSRTASPASSDSTMFCIQVVPHFGKVQITMSAPPAASASPPRSSWPARSSSSRCGFANGGYAKPSYLPQQCHRPQVAPAVARMLEPGAASGSAGFARRGGRLQEQQWLRMTRDELHRYPTFGSRPLPVAVPHCQFEVPVTALVPVGAGQRARRRTTPQCIRVP